METFVIVGIFGLGIIIGWIVGIAVRHDYFPIAGFSLALVLVSIGMLISCRAYYDAFAFAFIGLIAGVFLGIL